MRTKTLTSNLKWLTFGNMVYKKRGRSILVLKLLLKRSISLSNLNFDRFGYTQILELIRRTFWIVNCFSEFLRLKKHFQNQIYTKIYCFSKLFQLNFILLILWSRTNFFWNCLHFGHNQKNECKHIQGFQTYWKWQRCNRKFKTEPNPQFKI